MHVETAINAISEWYGDENFEIGRITTTPKGSAEDFDQSDVFISVIGYQNSVGMGGDSFEGSIYFEFEPGKFISTRFWC